MKIALYSPFWPAARAQNGIVTYVDIMRRALIEAGHDCVVVTPWASEEAAAQPDVFVLPETGDSSGMEKLVSRARAKFDREASWRSAGKRITRALEEASKNAPVDVVDMEESFGIARHIEGAPVIPRLHGPHFLGHFGARTAHDELRIEAEGKALRAAPAVTSPSPGLLKATEEFYGGIAALAETIPNPVMVPPQEDCWRADACDPNLILFVGRFDLRKGADVMIDAFSKVAAHRKGLRLVMAGKDEGLEIETGEKISFPEYARRFLDGDLASRIKFLGPVPQDDLRELRRRAFVYVSASRFECCAYAVTEAMSQGCPIIASSTFGPREFVTAGDALLVTEVGNAEDLAARIDALCADPSKACDLGAAARNAVIETFSPEKVARDMTDFFTRAISQTERSAARHFGR